MGQRLRPRVRVTQFFDIGALASAADRAWAHAMKRVGASIRRTGQDTMKNRRYGKNAPISIPGAYPIRHSTTNNSLRNIQYDYDLSLIQIRRCRRPTLGRTPSAPHHKKKNNNNCRDHA